MKNWLNRADHSPTDSPQTEMKAFVMLPITQHGAMGGGIIALCLLLLFREQWFLDQTRRGQNLVRWCGPSRAPWVFRAILLAGISFGGLLANGTIRPIQW